MSGTRESVLAYQTADGDVFQLWRDSAGNYLAFIQEDLTCARIELPEHFLRALIEELATA